MEPTLQFVKTSKKSINLSMDSDYPLLIEIHNHINEYVIVKINGITYSISSDRSFRFCLPKNQIAEVIGDDFDITYKYTDYPADKIPSLKQLDKNINYVKDLKPDRNIYIELEEEFQQLNRKIRNLKLFIDSDKYQTLDEEDQNLLFIQHESMRTYAACLMSRIKKIERN